MTIFLASSCQTILQKSGVVALSGPYKYKSSLYTTKEIDNKVKLVYKLEDLALEDKIAHN